MSAFDLIVIGSGSGGYVAALRGAQLGLKVALIEKASGELGGTCLWRGCIPTKTWLESARRLEHARELKEFGILGGDTSAFKPDLAAIVARKNRLIARGHKGIELLLKQQGVTRFQAHARLLGPGQVALDDGTVLEAQRMILASGSRPKHLPQLQPDGQRILDSDQLLDIQEIPEHLVILGAGAIGVEFASVFARLGSKITLVASRDRLLPQEEAAIGHELTKLLIRRYKMQILTHTRMAACSVENDHILCQLTGAKAGELRASHLLAAGGREPVTTDLGLERTRIQLDERGCIRTNALMETDEPGVYAIGDVVNTPMLAHVASAEGTLAAEAVAASLGRGGQPQPLDYDRIPSCTYCDPETGCVGLSEAKAQERGHTIITGSANFLPILKAHIAGEPYGFVKVVADATDRRILGLHILGPQATELVAIGGAILGQTLDQALRQIYPHPSLCEILPEALHACK